MKLWPMSALAVIVALTTAYIGATWFVYDTARRSYYAVGYNDGKIDQRIETIENIRTIAAVPQCRKASVEKEVALLTVKDVMLVAARESGGLRFCLHE